MDKEPASPFAQHDELEMQVEQLRGQILTMNRQLKLMMECVTMLMQDKAKACQRQNSPSQSQITSGATSTKENP